MVTHTDNHSTFSLQRIRDKILEGHAQADWHQREHDDLAAAIQTAEAQLQVCQTDNSASEQQALISAVRHLDELLHGQGGDVIEAGSIGERDHQIELAAARAAEFEAASPEFATWLAQASDDELAGLRESVAVAASGGVW